MAEIKFRVDCGECNATLDATAAFFPQGGGGAACVVEPCSACLEKAREEGWLGGKEEGLEEGRDEAAHSSAE